MIPIARCAVPTGGNDTGPPGFFDLDARSSPDNPPGDGANKCFLTSWQIDATAESISGSCFQYDYDYNSLFFEWDLQRVGPAPGG